MRSALKKTAFFNEYTSAYFDADWSNPDIFAPLRFAFEKFAFERFIAEKVVFFRLTPLKSMLAKFVSETVIPSNILSL